MTTDGVERYEALLFDMDGVLIQGAETVRAVYDGAADDALAELGASVPETERGPFRRPRFTDETARRCRAVGLDPERFWATRERFANERATCHIGSGPRAPFEDTAALAELPDPVGIVSNNRAATVEHVADSLFPGRFAVAIGRDPTLEGYRRRKPDPHYIERALDGLGVERALYVGDREHDIVAAHRAGIDGALVRREHGPDGPIDETPAFDIESLEALPGLLDP